MGISTLGWILLLQTTGQFVCVCQKGLKSEIPDDVVYIFEDWPARDPPPPKDNSVLGRASQNMRLMKALGENFHKLNQDTKFTGQGMRCRASSLW